MNYYRAPGNDALLVSLTEAKAQCRVDHSAEDDLITGLIRAATERAEQETGLVFGEGEWIVEVEPSGDLALPIWPVASVVSLTDGVDPFGDYTLSRSHRTVTLSSSSWPKSIVAVVQAGMPLPHTVKQAILLMVGWWYDQRAAGSSENMHEVPLGATALLGLNRRMFA